MFWGLILPMQDYWPGKPDVGVRPPAHGEPLLLFSFVVHPPRVMGLNYTISPSCLPVSLPFLLYIFSCRSLLLVFLLSSYSVHSCNFSMPVGRGGLRVFLLCLGYFSADFLLKDILPDEQNFNSFICSANIADHKIRFRKNLKTEDTDMSMPQSLASRNPKSYRICICQQHGNYFLPFVGKIVSLQLRHSLQQGNKLITVPLSFQVWLLLNRHRQIGMSSLSCP